jgi:hypothetical protein
VDALEREVEGLRTAAGGLEQEHQVLLSLLALLVQSTNLYWYKSTTVVMQMRAEASIRCASVYFLYWCKRTNTGAPQFTCFTGTKVQVEVLLTGADML